MFNEDQTAAPEAVSISDLESRLEMTRQRLSLAAEQLVLLARDLLANDQMPLSDRHNLLNEMALADVIANVQDARRELAEATELATHVPDQPATTPLIEAVKPKIH